MASSFIEDWKSILSFLCTFQQLWISRGKSHLSKDGGRACDHAEASSCSLSCAETKETTSEIFHLCQPVDLWTSRIYAMSFTSEMSPVERVTWKLPVYAPMSFPAMVNVLQKLVNTLQPVYVHVNVDIVERHLT